MKLAFVFVLLAACDQVYGLRGRDDTAPIDAGPEIPVTGTFTRHALYNALDGTPTSRTIALVDDDRPVVTSFGEEIAVTWNAVDGTFAFAAPTPYEVRFGSLGWQSSSPTLALRQVHIGRPEAPAASSVELQVTVPAAPASGTRFELVSTGVWSRQLLGSDAPTFTLDWTKGTFYTTVPRLLDTAAGDVLALATYAETANVGQEVLASFATADIQMMEGSQSVSFTPAPVEPIGCTRVVPTSDADVSRLRDAFPTFAAGDAGGWQFDVAPVVEQFGISLPLPLALRYVVGGDSQALDVTYGNPFVGHSVLLIQSSSVIREIEGDAQLFANITHQQPVTPSTTSRCTPVEAGAGSVALPMEWKLAGIPLANDGLTIAVPDRAFADLTWSIAGEEPDAYYVELFRIPAISQAFEIVQSMTTIEPRARFPTSLFESGARYVFRIIARTGLDSAITGDFTRVSPTAWLSSVHTSTFIVVR